MASGSTPRGAAGYGVDEAHALRVGQVIEALEVDPDSGLSDAEVRRRRRVHGRNELGEGGGVSWWTLLWRQLASAVVVLLLGAGVAGFVVGEVIEAAAILVVLVVNAIVGFVTELQAARSMEALSELLGTGAEVERGNRRDEIDAAELVPGDVVGVEAGEQVPADLRLIEAEGLAVEEAGLTGESEAVGKAVDPVARDAPLGDRSNMLYMGTTVVAGRGRGVVVATGRDTQMGRIADLAGSTEQVRAPLQRGLDQLSHRLAVAVVVGAAALFQARDVARPRRRGNGRDRGGLGDRGRAGRASGGCHPDHGGGNAADGGGKRPRTPPASCRDARFDHGRVL